MDLKLLKDRTFALVDVETTGTGSNYDRIIEIGILRIENGQVVKTFQSLVNPEKSLSPFITSITGIRPEDLYEAPTFDDIKDKIYELLDGAVFVAHNVRFDYGFVRNEFKRSGVHFQAKCLCTVRLSRKLFSRYKRHDLSSLIARFGFSCESRHRAFDDAKVMWDFLTHIKDSGREEELCKTIDDMLKTSTFPHLLDERTIANLPHGPGIYIFYGPDDEVLYVGKSKNLRFRVMSHFSNDHRSQKEMHICQQTKRIETRETAGELGALLLESKLVKELCPLYNRQLRKTSFLVVARKKVIDGYFSVVVERINEISKDGYGDIVGVFRSIRQAKDFLRGACEDYGLCPHILGLEKQKGACFSFQIDKCKGACVGKHDADCFNQDFMKAFARRRLRAWSFKGPILIEERGDEETHSFVLDNWCLLGDFKIGEDDAAPNLYPQSFDYDSYKIFVNFLREKSNRKKIKMLSDKEFESLFRHEEREIVVD